MRTLKSSFLFAIFVTVSLLLAAENIVGQGIAVQVKKGDLAQMPIENVMLEEEGIVQLLSRFSFAYNIRVGLEVARGDDQLTVYRIDFKKGTLSELFTQLMTEHKEYSWKIEDGVVSVFPKEDYRDPIVRELLQTKIRNFSVSQKTTTMMFGQKLLSTPEIERIVELYGLTYDTGYIGGFYLQQLGQQYSFHASNTELRSILNEVIKGSPVGQNWIISNDSSAKKLSLRVNVRLEYSPKL